MSDAEFAECSNCLCFGLRRASRVMSQHFGRYLRPTGLQGPQFSLLVSLAQSGPLPLGRLASRLGLERTTLTRNLRPLMAKRWVSVDAGRDQRSRTVILTAEGRAAARRALPAWRKAQATAWRKLDDLKLDDLLAARP
jgi:DNA-binding MarR family transcriptional regulator